MYIIRKVKNLLPTDILSTLYHSMVHPHLIYCISIYSSATKTQLQKLILQQKKAIRLICNAKYKDHTAPLFKKQKILPFDKLITYANLNFMHQYVNNLLPSSFNNLWKKNVQNVGQMRLRNADDFAIPRNRIETTKRFPLTNMPSTWNEAENVKLIQNRTTFKITLKKELIDSIDIQTEQRPNL